MGRFLAFILGLAGALVASQGPSFTNQYVQNLQGRIDELRPLVEQFDANVGAYGYTRDTAIAECSTATGLLDALCSTYRMAVTRYELLSAHMTELEAAGDWMRPVALARTYYRDIANSVYGKFEPAVPATIHGAAYAGGGFALLWGGASAIFGMLGGLLGGGRRYA